MEQLEKNKAKMLNAETRGCRSRQGTLEALASRKLADLWLAGWGGHSSPSEAMNSSKDDVSYHLHPVSSSVKCFLRLLLALTCVSGIIKNYNTYKIQNCREITKSWAVVPGLNPGWCICKEKGANLYEVPRARQAFLDILHPFAKFYEIDGHYCFQLRKVRLELTNLPKATNWMSLNLNPDLCDTEFHVGSICKQSFRWKD